MSEEDEKEAKRMIVTSATRGKVQELEALLEMFPHMVDCTCQGHTGLHQACHHGHADAILSLLHRGASLTAQDFQGYTPLHHAAYGNDYTGSTAQLLISVGKEIDLNDARNEPCRSTPLALAVSRNNVGSAAVLIGAGCDVNAQDRNGLTPLHSAVLLGDMHMVHELLKAPSVNLKICDNQRMNPFLSAVNRKFHRAVEAMVTHSPNIVNVPEFGRLMTALHFSAVNDDVETALILLQTEKCDTRARNKNGQTALEQAISAESSSVMELLSSLETGAETRCSFQKLASGNHTKCQKGDVVLCVGDRVRLVDDKETLEVLQMGHGGYTFHMNLNLGKQAIVTDTLPGGDVRISTEQLGHQFVMNPAALELVESQQDNLGFPFNITPSDVPVYIDAQEMDDHSKAAALLSGAAGAGSLPVVQAVLERYPDVADQQCLDAGAVSSEPSYAQPQLKCYDYVKILDNEEIVKKLQKSHGPWDDSFCKVLGQTGRILSFNSEGDVEVIVGPSGEENIITFNPAVLSLSSADDKEENEKRQPDVRVYAYSQEMDDLSKAAALLSGAAGAGDLPVVEAVLERYPNVIDLLDQAGHTALHSACHQGHFEVVAFLVERGFSIELKDWQGYTALHHAAYSDRSGKTASVLVLQGANIDENQNEYGSTPLHLSIKEYNTETAKVLIQAGCNVNLPELNGFSALALAIFHGDADVVESLLDRPDLLLDLAGCPPFYSALTGKDCPETVKAIIQRFPKTARLPLDHDMTPLHFAALYDNVALAKFLLEKGEFDLNLKNKSGLTPITLAHMAGSESFMEIMQEQTYTNQQTSLGSRDPSLVAAIRSELLKLVSKSVSSRKTFYREFKFGDKVQVLGNRALVEAYQIGNGGWVDAMETVLRKFGHVEEVLENGNIRVCIQDPTALVSLIFNPLCLDPAEGD